MTCSSQRFVLFFSVFVITALLHFMLFGFQLTANVFPCRNYVLRITDSIGNAGVFRWEILLCLIAAWIGVYFCMWKGVKSSGKVTI